ncbi:MAG: ABC transporter ATP-binding protein [Deltaproteobacteria bacterium]|nr:ABC transporter ATP-binding protein [Deltaproteobacteria bacterium]
MAAAVLEARGVSRRFMVRGGGQTVEAVRNMSVSVRPGEMVIVAGPSGSGKTTLLHLLAAIDSPTSGEIFIEGTEVSRLSRGERAELRLRRLGLVFSDHNLSPALTVAENVDLPLALRGLPSAERALRVKATLNHLGIDGLASRFPDALSSGEQQRVAVARAVAGDPAVLVADEPTAHLDSDGTEALLGLLEELVAQRRMAAVIASHDLRMIKPAGRVIRLKDGAVEENG